MNKTLLVFLISFTNILHADNTTLDQKFKEKVDLREKKLDDIFTNLNTKFIERIEHRFGAKLLKHENMDKIIRAEDHLKDPDLRRTNGEFDILLDNDVSCKVANEFFRNYDDKKSENFYTSHASIVCYPGNGEKPIKINDYIDMDEPTSDQALWIRKPVSAFNNSDLMIDGSEQGKEFNIWSPGTWGYLFSGSKVE